MTPLRIIGLLLLLLGIGMFVFGVSMFSYQGSLLNQWVSDLGMYSFSFWLPVTILGMVLMRVGKRKQI